jgi:phosphomannomutase
MELKMQNFKKLQNGNDIRGVALEGVENENVNLTPQIAQKLACAFCVWLKNKKQHETLKFSVGCDSRLSGEDLKQAVISGITGQGYSVGDFGLASTPAMFMSTVLNGYHYDGAIMITASHLPFNRNGLKFFTVNGGLEKNDISEIIEIAENHELSLVPVAAKALKVDFMSAYALYLVDRIRKCVDDKEHYYNPLHGFKIIVDAGNGAGGFFAKKVLEPLGADTYGSQFLEPDGHFPNHVPNPEDKFAMQSVCSATIANGADLGIIFDTDVDRAGAVDKNGKEINRNRIIALMASIVLEEHPGSTIVTDSITSDELGVFIKKNLHGVHHRFKRGYKNVINEAIRLNAQGTECHLAIETSGHGALKENYFLDDGAYLMAKILIKIAKLRKQGKTIDTLLLELQEPLEAREFRFNIKESDFKTYGNMVIDKLFAYATEQPLFTPVKENHEGIRVSMSKEFGGGWFLLRMSLHDPLMPLNIESNTAGGVHKIAVNLYEFLNQFKGLDISSVEDFIKQEI